MEASINGDIAGQQTCIAIFCLVGVEEIDHFLKCLWLTKQMVVLPSTVS